MPHGTHETRFRNAFAENNLQLAAFALISYPALTFKGDEVNSRRRFFS
jgi:hypothetical protein